MKYSEPYLYINYWHPFVISIKVSYISVYPFYGLDLVFVGLGREKGCLIGSVLLSLFSKLLSQRCPFYSIWSLLHHHLDYYVPRAIRFDSLPSCNTTYSLSQNSILYSRFLLDLVIMFYTILLISHCLHPNPLPRLPAGHLKGIYWYTIREESHLQEKLVNTLQDDKM